MLRLEAGDGAVGFGEAAPFEPYDGVPLERAIAALRGGGGRRPPQARAAEEIARLDLRGPPGGAAARPSRARDAIPVNMTLPAGPPEEVGRSAHARACGAGYACFKLKVGLPDDDERVAAVREAIGPWPALRVDANGAWSVDEAVTRIRALEAHDLELVEQPCRTPRGAAPRCASACPRRSPPTSRSHRCARVRARGRARGLRRGERQARRRRRLQARPRGAARWPARTASAPSCRARSTARGASPPRCSSPPPRTSRWPAGWPRSSCSTGRWRARSPRPADGHAAGARRPGLGRRARRGTRRGPGRRSRSSCRSAPPPRAAGAAGAWPAFSTIAARPRSGAVAAIRLAAARVAPRRARRRSPAPAGRA